MFGGTVYYYTDLAKFRKAMKRKIGDDPGEASGWTIADDSGNFYVGVFDGNPATVVHESVHIAMTILERVGIEPYEANGEPVAYLVDHLFAQLMKVHKKEMAKDVSAPVK